MFLKRGRYDGPVCFVPFDMKPAKGRKMLEGGWHYSTRIDRKLGEIPHKKLHLNDEGEVPFYEYAKRSHKSWVEKHGQGNLKMIGG